ncbi:MAG: acylphosphatase [bacterium]
MKQIGYQIMITGTVQGVGYRSYCQEVATALGLTGSVMNLPNRSVEVEVFGNKILIDEFINKITEPSDFYVVDTIIKNEIPAKTNNSEFMILHYPGY